ncbi:Bro-N domain-containing protein [Vogesella sp. GCM10023246]|uniref:Bro-N domain-containing protein n=1 Tax=Vogesella oryzagri TaxID=3160864 RepID=A0ABV1M908_9NEIS
MAAQTHTLGASAPTVFSFDSFDVRTLSLDGEVWFVASDVAVALDYRDAANMVRSLDDDEADTHILSVRSDNGVEQCREVRIINESGLFSAILKSRKPEAKRFKRWVTHEVLPSLRKSGSYALPSAAANAAVPGVAMLGDVPVLTMQRLKIFSRLGSIHSMVSATSVLTTDERPSISGGARSPSARPR